MRHLLIAITACFAAPIAAAPTAVPMSIVATANATATLSTLVKALVAGGLVDTLSGSGPFTVFAPNDLAFAQLPAGTLEKLLDPRNVRQLQALLLYHVAAGNIPSTDFGPRQEVTTANGAQVLIVANMTAPPPYGVEQVFVNQAKVVVPNVICTNGIVHIINSVLIPPWWQHEMLKFEAAPATVALQTVAAPKTRIIKTAYATAGAEISTRIKTRGAGPALNIVETANATADLSTLVKALRAGALVETLSGSGPFTVFAPTDLAFDELPAETLAMLLDPKNLKQLQAVLLYHVVSGTLPSTDFGPEQNVTTVNGAQVLIVANMTAPPPYGVRQVFVNQAQVQKADVGCTNGIVHIINRVLIPPSLL